MFRKDQKIFGFALDGEEWKEFDSWSLMTLFNESEVEYRIWKSNYERKIHVSRNLNSDLIFFNINVR